MPLPIVVDAIDAVPEAARGAYVQRDGKFHLDAEFEDTSALKSKNAQLLEEKRKLSERAAILGDRKPEEIQADLTFAAEQRARLAEEKGQFDVLKGQLIEQHTKEKEKLTGRTQQVEGKLFDVLAKREAELAIKELEGDEVVLLPHILPFIKVVEQDGDFVAQVVDAKGNPRIADDKGTPMTIKQLVETFKANERFGVAFKATSTSGSGARNDPSSASRGSIVIIPKDATPQEYRRLKEQAEKDGKQYQVAS